MRNLPESDVRSLEHAHELAVHQNSPQPRSGRSAILTSIGLGLVLVQALRMLAAVGSQLATASADELGDLDALHRVGQAFADLGVTHGLLLSIGVGLIALPQLLQRRLSPTNATKSGIGLGVAVIAAVLGVVGGVLALRLELRTTDAENFATSISTVLQNTANLLATTGASLVAMIAAFRVLGLDNED